MYVLNFSFFCVFGARLFYCCQILYVCIFVNIVFILTYWQSCFSYPCRRCLLAAIDDPFLHINLNSPAVSPTVKGRTNLKIKEKYLSPAGSSAKGLTVSRSNSSLSLYSSASAPTSPMTRKASQKVCAVTAGNIYYLFLFFCPFVSLNSFFFCIKLNQMKFLIKINKTTIVLGRCCHNHKHTIPEIFGVGGELPVLRKLSEWKWLKYSSYYISYHKKVTQNGLWFG